MVEEKPERLIEPMDAIPVIDERVKTFLAKILEMWTLNPGMGGGRHGACPYCHREVFNPWCNYQYCDHWEYCPYTRIAQLLDVPSVQIVRSGAKPKVLE